jgi:hypothetical protein
LRVFNQCAPTRFLLLRDCDLRIRLQFHTPRSPLSAALLFARSMSPCAFAPQWTVQATRSLGAASPPLRVDTSADTVTPHLGGFKSRFATTARSRPHWDLPAMNGSWCSHSV